MGFNEDKLNVMFGLRADFSVTDTEGAAASEPGAGAVEGVVFGGDGCGGLESLGSVY